MTPFIHTHEEEKLAHAHVEVATEAFTHAHLQSHTHTKSTFVINWLEFLDLMQQLFLQFSMEQSYNVGISTLHGNIIHIDVEAQTLVKVFKQQCIDESQLDVVPLKINVDLAGLMNGDDKFTKWEGCD